MHIVHDWLLQIHIGIGALALIAFWLPVATRKGSANHIKAGRLYVYSMYAVAVSALMMSAMVYLDPIGIRFPERNLEMERAMNIANQSRMFAAFLFMLGLLVLSGLRHGLLALKTRQQADALRTLPHRTLIIALGVVGLVVGISGLQNMQLLLIIFGALSVSASVSMLRESRIAKLTANQRIIAHFSGLIGTGIGAYTALFAFGGSRLLSQVLSGQWQVIPWIAPAIIGTIAIRRTQRQYQQGGAA
ncbi:MAG: hypothetical protein AAF270_08885 [Pseudomonadota bacterium]